MLKFFQENFKKIYQGGISAWNSYYRVVFLLAMIGFMFAGFYFWYSKVYAFKWSEERKKEYIDSKEQTVNFKEEKFQKLLQIIEQKQKSFHETNRPKRNIFQPY